MELENALSQDGESKGGVLAHLERLETQVNRSRKKLEEPQGEGRQQRHHVTGIAQ